MSKLDFAIVAKLKEYPGITARMDLHTNSALVVELGETFKHLMLELIDESDSSGEVAPEFKLDVLRQKVNEQ
jgi:hypothetical protein